MSQTEIPRRFPSLVYAKIIIPIDPILLVVIENEFYRGNLSVLLDDRPQLQSMLRRLWTDAEVQRWYMHHEDQLNRDQREKLRRLPFLLLSTFQP